MRPLVKGCLSGHLTLRRSKKDMVPRANDTPRYFSDHVLCAVALAIFFGSGGGGRIGAACFVLATGGQCLHARDGFRQGRPIEACESEVNIGGVACSLFRALSLHFYETPMH
jgi:hypothetical protein